MPIEHPAPGTPAPIRQDRAVEVYANRFGHLYDDEVVFPGGTEGRYLRWQWSQQGVVVVPVGPQGMALLPMYRYPVGAVSLEFPRGGCAPGEAPRPRPPGNWRRSRGWLRSRCGASAGCTPTPG